MRPLSSGFRRFGLVALILVMLSYPAVAWDDRGMRPGVPRVQVLLIIDRQAGVSGTNVTEQKIRRLADAMKGGGLSGDPIVLDSNLSPDAILATVRAMVPGGQGALLIYYFGHGGTDPYRGHLLATSGGNLWSSALIEEARTRAPLVVLLTDACSTGFSAVTATTASAVTGSGAPAAPVGYETTRNPQQPVPGPRGCRPHQWLDVAVRDRHRGARLEQRSRRRVVHLGADPHADGIPVRPARRESRRHRLLARGPGAGDGPQPLAVRHLQGRIPERAISDQCGRLGAAEGPGHADAAVLQLRLAGSPRAGNVYAVARVGQVL